MTMALGRWAFLFPDRQFTRHVRAVHGFIDGFVSAALREHDTKPPGRVPDTPAPKPYVLLHALVEEQDGVKDPVRIRDELVNILIAGRDTTASLISTLFFVLSRRPDIWAKLRDEVRQFEGGRPPKFEEIPLCRYLRWTINECTSSRTSLSTRNPTANRKKMN
jgi:cytochrome P450